MWNPGVEEGDLLVELDDTIDRATLKSANVRLEKTRRDFERDRSLFERGLVSEDEFELSRSDFQSAEALVEETQGIIDKKTIRAPFTGTLGIHNLAEGQYLEPGDTLVTLQALDTLFLDMKLPEKELERVRPGQRVAFSVPSHGDREFEGEVQFVNVVVEANPCAGPGDGEQYGRETPARDVRQRHHCPGRRPRSCHGTPPGSRLLPLRRDPVPA